MSRAKSVLRQILGNERALSMGYSYRDLKSRARWWLTPEGRESTRRLWSYKDHHRGQRCVIIGNGPSLNRTNLHLLKNEITFGMNRVYLLFEELGFGTTYYVSVNRYVLEQCAAEISRLQCSKFLSWVGRKWFSTNGGVVFLRTGGQPRFTTALATQQIWEGATVTYVAMQLAYYMGFHTVILVGVDHCFSTQGAPHTVVTSEGEDPNHFHPDYFGKGFRWQLPDLHTSERAYLMAKQQFEKSGRVIIDATVDGRLQVFPKVDLAEALGRSQNRPRR